MDNVTRQQIIGEIESMGMEVAYLISIGEYKRAEQLRQDMETLILDFQN